MRPGPWSAGGEDRGQLPTLQISPGLPLLISTNPPTLSFMRNNSCGTHRHRGGDSYIPAKADLELQKFMRKRIITEQIMN